jgi:hypothetical protein
LKKSPLGFLYKAVKQKGHDNISYMTWLYKHGWCRKKSEYNRWSIWRWS